VFCYHLSMTLLDHAHLSDRELHDTCRGIAKQRKQAEFGVCAGLLAVEERALFSAFGYASVYEYGERVFGLMPRAVKDRLRVAHRLVELPEVAARFRAGELGYTAVRELVRTATAENVGLWLEEARGRTGTELKRMVRGLERGAAPGDPPQVEDRTTRVSFELSPQAYAHLQEARAAMVRDAGESVDDSAFITELSLALLGGGGGERDAGKAAFQIAIAVDPVHGGARLVAGGDAVPVDDVTLEMARCDATEIGRVDGPDSAPRATQTIPPKVRRQVNARHDGCCGVPGCFLRAFTHLHHLDLVSEGGQHDPERMIPLCTQHHDAVHRGALHITGRFSTGFGFFHADGRPYGSPDADAALAATFASAFEALTDLGYKDKEARPMLEAVRTEVPYDADLSAVMHAALRAAPMPPCVREEVVAYLPVHRLAS
jgi:hypothetical protein